MLKTIIIADDNTGANASGILLNKLNFNTLSLINYDKSMNIDEFDALAISTDSRAVEKTEAYNRVYQILGNFSEVNPLLYNKRIDSTLRGNLGIEIEAFMDFFPNKKIAVVPSFPNSKRICKEGIIYVDGKELAETDVAKDPKMPIHSSIAKDLILKQSNKLIANIYLSEIRNNDNLTELIINTYIENDIIIFDSETNQDIEIVSKALVKSGYEIISVDPGPFTYYYSKALLSSKINNRFVYLIGSVVDTTFAQIEHIAKDQDFDIIYANPNQMYNEKSSLSEVSRVLDIASKTNKEFIVITTTDIKNREVLNLSEIGKQNNCSAEDISNKINDNLAEILINLLEKDASISGVFCSGGDTSLGFLKKSKASGIKLITEVLPLSVYGKVVGGKYNGLTIITKGGMIGEVDAYSTIKNFFKEEVTNE